MKAFVDRFETGIHHLNAFLAGLVAISIGFMAVLISLDLFIRGLKWGNMPWLYEGVEYALYFGIFLGAPWVLQHGAHVRVDVLLTVLPKGAAVRLEQVIDVACAALCAALCYYGIEATILHYVEGSLPDKMLRIDNWYLLSAFAVAFAMLTIEFLLRARRAHVVGVEETDPTAKAGF